MFVRQSDFFWGMDKSLVKEIMDAASKEFFEKGDALFYEGDPADTFYVLLKGEVKLFLGEEGQTVYIVSHPGEAFGWSSLIGRTTYTASAVCGTTTRLLKFERKAIEATISASPHYQASLYKQLTQMLGNRLIGSYRMQIATQGGDIATSYGARHLMEPQALT